MDSRIGVSAIVARDKQQGSRDWLLPKTSNHLIVLASSWLLLAGNWPFWRAVWQSVGGWHGGATLFLPSLPLFVWLWLFLLLSLLAWGRLTKPVLAAVLLISAASSYFMDSYGIVIDPGMIANVAQTDAAEALELFSWRLGGWLLVFGVLPAWVIIRIKVTPAASLRRAIAARVLAALAAAACLAAIVFSQYQSYASLLRNHRELRLLLVPWNVAAAIHGYAKNQLAAPRALTVVGADAHLAAHAAAGAKRRLVVLVVGETARAANFALNGYPRATNPELAGSGILSFGQVSSCGTATAVSLPCMFLDAGRSGYEEGMAKRREGLLDVLQRAGVAVQWRDNNSGCKGVCDRVPYETAKAPDLCQGDACYDEALLRGLQDFLDRQAADTLVVLHMKGSHGPSYFKRYPPEFERFKPVCQDNQLDRCDRQSIVNAYDNSLLYTDHVLAKTIDLLKRNSQRFDTGLVYVSDHGESLGENGLYLHGFPYAMAPREQTRIPMLVWLSDGLARRKQLDVACLTRQQDRALSHDNLFHSILGLMDVQTVARRANQDLFAACEPPEGAALAVSAPVRTPPGPSAPARG